MAGQLFSYRVFIKLHDIASSSLFPRTLGRESGKNLELILISNLAIRRNTRENGHTRLGAKGTRVRAYKKLRYVTFLHHF